MTFAIAVAINAACLYVWWRLNRAHERRIAAMRDSWIASNEEVLKTLRERSASLADLSATIDENSQLLRAVAPDVALRVTKGGQC